MLFEAQQQTDLLDRISDLIKVLKEPAEVVVIEQEVVAIPVNESEAEPEEPAAIQPEPEPKRSGLAKIADGLIGSFTGSGR